MKAAELWQVYQEAKRQDLPPLERGRIYAAWFAQSFREGADPTRLDEDSLDLGERVAARSIPGPDGHLIWVGKLNKDGNPIIYTSPTTEGRKTNLTVRRLALLQAGKQVPLRRRIQPTCGEALCVNPDHLELESHGWTQRYTDEEMLGKLQAWALRHGRAPSRGDWEGQKPAYRAYQARFGSWNRAKERAGIGE